MPTQEKTPISCPVMARPATTISEELATIQEEFGRLSAEATKAIADGTLTYLERSAMIIRLRGLQRSTTDLLEALR